MDATLRYTRLFSLENIHQTVFLFGPRGTGKTAWLKAHCPDALYFDLLMSETYAELLANPSRLENKIPPDYHDWIIIDEIQKIPQLLDEVHRLIELKGVRFILTGSSARKLKQKGVNLLAGRALDFRMHPLTCTELGDDFSLEYALQYGLLPSVYNNSEPLLYLNAYIGTYLREEILQEGLVRNLGEFTRFLEAASFSQGEVLNMTDVAREAAVERRVVSGYFDILEDLLIAIRLPVFSKRAKRKLTSHPKFYYFDAGVYRAIRPKGPLDSPMEIDGPVLETLFLEHLRAINDYYRLGYQFYYWRTQTQKEVDFVAYGERGLIAFEIKRKKNLSSKDFSGLVAFKQDYEMATLFMLHGGSHKEYHGDVTVIPFEEALRSLETILRGAN